MKTTLCTADDQCRLSSLRVSSPGSACWLNGGKLTGWHSGSNYHRLTCCVTAEISGLFSHTDMDRFHVVRRFLPFNKSLIFPQLCGFTLSCLSELVYPGSLRSPSITPICWWIATQCLLRSVWDKSPPFLQTYYKASLVANVHVQHSAIALSPHLPPGNHLHITSRVYMRLVIPSPHFAGGGEESMWDLAVLDTSTLVRVD